MNHALVTGGAGFIGSHLVDLLLREGWRVTVVDNFDPFYPAEVKRRNIAAHFDYSGYRLINADITDDQTLRREAYSDYDAVIHLAAKAGVRPSILDPAGYQRVNVGGTQNMLELARQCAAKQFVLASSSSVYGVNPNMPWRECDQVLLPISPYASTKVSCELLAHVYSHLYELPVIGLRFFTVYGPRQRPDLAIHKFTRAITEGKPVAIFGDGSTSRDYTYVTDIVAGIRSAMDYRSSRYEILNLGNNAAVSLLEMIETIGDALGMKPRLEFYPEQPGDVPHTRADIAKAQALIGYQSRTSFRAGVERFVEWFIPEYGLARSVA